MPRRNNKNAKFEGKFGNVKAAVKKVANVRRSIQQAQKTLQKLPGVGNSSFLRHPGATLGRAFGGTAGAKAGNFLGRILGTGDYSVKQNSLLTSSRASSGDSVPTFVEHGRGVRIIHREYLGEVVSSATTGKFSVTSYSLNPGLFSSFPWLAGFANQFDEWKPNGMVACFKSTSSFYSGTAALGAVILASDYDVLDTAYASKIEMENSEFAVSGSTATNLLHPIECNISERPTPLLYTRSGSVATTDNQRFYDLANLQIASVGCPASTVLGELWLSYDITLYKPQLFGGVLNRGQLFGEYMIAATATGANMFTSIVTTANSSIQDINPGLVTANKIIFPEKYVGAYWKVTILVAGTAAATTSPTIPTLAGGMVGHGYDGDVNGINSFFNNGAAAQTCWVYMAMFQQTASPSVASSITFAAETWPTTPLARSVMFLEVIAQAEILA